VLDHFLSSLTSSLLRDTYTTLADSIQSTKLPHHRSECPTRNLKKTLKEPSKRLDNGK